MSNATHETIEQEADAALDDHTPQASVEWGSHPEVSEFPDVIDLTEAPDEPGSSDCAR